MLCAPLVAAQDADHWIDVMREGTSEARKAGREALLSMGPAAMPALIEATHDALDFIRWEAVNALGSLATDDPMTLSDAIPAIAERSLTDADSHTRWRSLWALSVFTPDLIEDRLLPILCDGLAAVEGQHQWYAAVAMAYFDQAEAAPLLNVGLDREAAFDRWEAVYCLGMVHNEDSVGLLGDLILDVENREVGLRQEAALVLGRIGDPVAIPVLLQALLDPAPEVRWRAASSLEGLGGTEYLPEIEAALSCETDTIALDMLTTIVDRLRKAETQEQE